MKYDARSFPINSYCKKLGFGWTVATDNGKVFPPIQPQLTGTIRQIREAQRSNPQYQADLDRIRCERWFHNGREIESIREGFLGRKVTDPDKIDTLIRTLDKDGAIITVKPQTP